MADDPSLDLNLLCFIDRFTEPDQIDNCKEIAKELVVWLIEQYGEDGFKTILQNSGELEYLDETVTLLKEFYQTKGIAFEPLQAMLRFGGYSFDYVLQTKEALFCIDRRFEDASLLSTSYICSSYEVLSVCYTLDENNNPALIYRVGLKTKARPGQEPEISEMISLIVRDTNPF